MLRTEFVLVGCILVTVGAVLSIVGLINIQESPLETTVNFLTQVSGAKIPDNFSAAKTTSYLLLLFGACVGLIGLSFILKSRSSNKSQ
jgi:uncharacterized membrane protein YiaA